MTARPRSSFSTSPQRPLRRREIVVLYVLAILIPLALSGAGAAVVGQYGLSYEPTLKLLTPYLCASDLRPVRVRANGTTRRRGYRIACVDADGREPGGASSAPTFKLMLPIFLPLVLLSLYLVNALRGAAARLR